MIRFAICSFLLVFGALALADDVSEPKYTLDDFDAAVAALEVASPSGEDPVQISATAVPDSAFPGESVVVVVKMRILDSWHIYSKVPKTQPYIESKWQIESDDYLRAFDDWYGPSATPYPTVPDLKIHKGGSQPLVFFREMVVTSDAEDPLPLAVSLLYQACDPGICLPPRTKTENINLRIRDY